MNSENRNITLETKNLSIGYRSKKKDIFISEGINFQLYEGELVGLVGSNGVGKSTLLRTLAAMQPKLKGDIFIHGKNNETLNPPERASLLSVVLTEPPASKNLTVQELVSLGRQPHTNWLGKLSENDISVITEALSATELLPLKNKKCFELSDGQLQRVYIARALAQDTPLILLDEPTTHLDLYHRAYVLKLLKKLASEKNKTILFSTHEIDLAIQLANKMIVMTPDNTVIGSPCTLIEQGKFNSLFPSEVVGFDRETGRFSVR